MTGQKQLNGAPRVTALVLRSGDYEATISGDHLTVSSVGIRDGRTKMFSLDEPNARQVLDLVEAARKALLDMASRPPA